MPSLKMSLVVGHDANAPCGPGGPSLWVKYTDRELAPEYMDIYDEAETLSEHLHILAKRKKLQVEPHSPREACDGSIVVLGLEVLAHRWRFMEASSAGPVAINKLEATVARVREELSMLNIESEPQLHLIWVQE